MKKHLVLPTVFAASLALASLASAQNPRQAMKQLDVNGDRKLQFSEIQSYRASTFDRFDINVSGILEANEIASMQQQAAEPRSGGPAGRCRTAKDGRHRTPRCGPTSARNPYRRG